jgi:ArsR family transcriptional regulator, arsenate/arsenite/antimonite-responsive transcriptional repressor
METSTANTNQSDEVDATERTEAPEPCCGGLVAAPALSAMETSTLADRLKALADPTRLRMLDLLVGQSQPLCVCDITAQFDQHQPTISHHLRILREAGLINGEKRGVWSYYWATDEGKRSVTLVKTLL